MSIERELWHTGHLPEGYPTKCDQKQLQDVIQDLSDERYQKIQGGKLNKIWESQISTLIQSGRDELQQRMKVDGKESRFSMNNPIVYIVVILILAAIAYVAAKFGLPLNLGSN